MQTIIEYKTKRQINIGDVFYTIERINMQFHQEPCKVCGGAKKLCINGVTFDCPCCDKQSIKLRTYQYKVNRWRVYGISQVVSHSYWKPSDDKMTEFLLYRIKTKDDEWCASTICKISDNTFNTRRNFDYDELKNACGGYLNPEECVYDCYSLAVKVANKFNDEEREKVITHNKEFNTDYEVRENPKHDPKN